MNRAERRRQRKKAKKAAKSAKPGPAANRSPKQQTLAIQQSLELAVQHHNAGDLAKAEGIYQQVLQADPSQPVALHLLGVIARQGGNNDIAVEFITKALAIKPDLTEAHINLGNALKDLGRLDEAMASYHKALAIKPDYAEAHSNLGSTLKELGRLDEAVTSYHKALAIKPDLTEAHINLGNALKDLGRLDEAMASYRKALAIKPDYAEAHSNLGLTLQDMGKLDEAVASYHKALVIKPDYAEAHCNLGDALQDLGKLDEAVASYRKALTIQPDFATAHSNLGLALQDMGKLDEAVASYHKALAIKPDLAEAHYNLGRALQDLGKLDEAVASYRKALTIQPDYVNAHNNLGNALKDLGRLDEAMASYHKALAIKPDYAEAHSNLGLTLQDMGKLDEAIASYHKALAIKPDYAEAHYNLGRALQDLGKLDETVASYRKALTIQPDFAEAHSNLGNVLRERGELEEAFTCQRRAIALKPQNDLFWAGLAASLETFSFTSVDEDLWQDLLHLLERPTVHPSYVTRPIIRALRHHTDFSQILELTRSGKPETGIAYGDAAERLSAIPLFLRIMGLSPINDLKIERMLTILRRAMIEETGAGKTDDKGLPFSAALALQCFTNEYVFSETDEEKAAVEQLQQQIATLVEKERDVAPSFVAALGAYRPLYGFPWSQELSEREWAGNIKEVIERQISEPRGEQSLRTRISRLTSIQNTVSQSVREQYEENPYPRWIKTGIWNKGRSIGACLQEAPLRLDLGDYQSPESPEILVAGCGTGQHALITASRFSNARVLAVDLSLSSLSYALRKTNELGFSNIEYAQGDIMELENLGRQFDLIESVGVLHHLGDPLAGWRVLADLLRPGGFMMIGLYSETARQHIISGRSLIAEKGYTTSPEDIRRCRQDIKTQAEDGNRKMAKVCNGRDFFSLSNCRDLLFHVQEHRFTLLQIEAALQALNLKFLGFEMRGQGTLSEFRKSHPHKSALTSLALWHQFELKNPDTFRDMYQFWCKKM